MLTFIAGITGAIISPILLFWLITRIEARMPPSPEWTGED